MPSLNEPAVALPGLCCAKVRNQYERVDPAPPSQSLRQRGGVWALGPGPVCWFVRKGWRESWRESAKKV